MMASVFDRGARELALLHRLLAQQERQIVRRAELPLAGKPSPD